jgi:alpha-tubulin suppressor-like RCC1 family protein
MQHTKPPSWHAIAEPVAITLDAGDPSLRETAVDSRSANGRDLRSESARVRAINRALGLSSFVTVVISGWLLLAVAAAVPWPDTDAGPTAQGSGPGGTVWAWGANFTGQLGQGSFEPAAGVVRVPVNDGVAALAAGSGHSLALRDDGTVGAWGANSYGQLGDGTRAYRTAPVRVPALDGIQAIAAGDYHSLALGRDGGVWAWGMNGQGQAAGDGSDLARDPTRVPGVPPASAVAAGANFSLVLTRDGEVWAWGANSHGTLGEGTIGGSHHTPAPVRALPRIVAIGAGAEHALAIDAHGALWSWGTNRGGQLGVEPLRGWAAPVRVEGLPPVVAATGGLYFSAASTANGEIWIWGTHGVGAAEAARQPWQAQPKPIRVPLIAAATALAAGPFDCLVLLDDGTIWGWGTPFPYGGASAASRLPAHPVPVNGLTNATALAVGAGHGLAIQAVRAHGVAS